MQPMVHDNENAAFSQRLNDLLDARGFAAKNYGRQKELAKKYDLVQQSVGKWLNGDGMPKTTQMMAIARDFGCNFEWLALGTGPRDADASSYGPLAELHRRIESAPPETVRLIELALMPETDLEQTSLSPSLKGLIGFVKQQIRTETPQ